MLEAAKSLLTVWRSDRNLLTTHCNCFIVRYPVASEGLPRTSSRAKGAREWLSGAWHVEGLMRAFRRLCIYIYILNQWLAQPEVFLAS